MKADVLDSTLSLAVVRAVLSHTGFTCKSGGGEPAIPMLVSAFLAGWGPLLRHLIQADLLALSTLRMLARFACNPRRLLVDAWGRIRCSGRRCTKANSKCPFKVPSHHTGNPVCRVATTDTWAKPRIRHLLLTCGGINRYNSPVPGDTVSVAERVLDLVMKPKIAAYAANDAAKAQRARIGMPTHEEWVGATFQLVVGPNRGMFPTFAVVDTKATASGRVKDLLLRDTRSDPADYSEFWTRLRPQGIGWTLAFPLWTPLPTNRFGASRRRYSGGWGGTVIRVARFPSLCLCYTNTVFNS